jgi:glutathione S-transferase
VHYALRYKRLPFEVVNTPSLSAVRTLSARGKLPIIKYDGVPIADSSEIIRHLEARSPEPRLFPLDPEMRARALLIEDWADESLYWHVVYERWMVVTQFRQIAGELFAQVPWLVRPIIKRSVRRQMCRELWNQGLGRLKGNDQREKLRQALDWLDQMVDGRFAAGPEFSIADIAAAAQIAALMIPQTPIGQSEMEKRPRLMGWLEGVRAAVS